MAADVRFRQSEHIYLHDSRRHHAAHPDDSRGLQLRKTFQAWLDPFFTELRDHNLAFLDYFVVYESEEALLLDVL